MFQNSLSQNQSHIASYGTFIALNRFLYPHLLLTKDIEMCVCKKHLHATWGIQTLINCSAKQGIDLETIRNYESFFEYLSGVCGSEETIYVDWKCTPDKHTLCKEISDKWNLLKENISLNN